MVIYLSQGSFTNFNHMPCTAKCSLLEYSFPLSNTRHLRVYSKLILYLAGSREVMAHPRDVPSPPAASDAAAQASYDIQAFIHIWSVAPTTDAPLTRGAGKTRETKDKRTSMSMCIYAYHEIISIASMVLDNRKYF